MTRGAGDVLAAGFAALTLSIAICATTFAVLSAVTILAIALTHRAPRTKKKRGKCDRDEENR